MLIIISYIILNGKYKNCTHNHLIYHFKIWSLLLMYVYAKNRQAAAKNREFYFNTKVISTKRLAPKQKSPIAFLIPALFAWVTSECVALKISKNC